MATTINASISSGLVQTADTSGVLQLQTAGTTALSIDSSQNPVWTKGSGAMVLLGTITPTAVNSISLTSLTLTNYKSLYIVFNAIALSANSSVYINSTSVQTGGGYTTTTGSTGTNAVYGTAWLDLGTSVIGGAIGLATNTSTGFVPVSGLTTVTTASTAIHFRLSSTSTFVASGSIVIYGVK